ncbi:histidine kinase [Haloarculaceae archaeon H-GB2-1]|nr:histidine kinase [Haloarculaceae archaeon H-GB1-1]MEA5388758.1 histidine kinase [Haloarculaceae archaeon H-GB11]MEA5406814.1 histidine kinase [Haloarculaceae archaeon H-GB2-1]
MAQEAQRVEEVSTTVGRPAWQSGVIGGLAGGLVMGILFSVMMPAVIENAIPALVGLSGGIAGWFVHMSISAVFGVGFAALVTRSEIPARWRSYRGMVSLGLVYGIGLWVIAAGIVMPVWLGAVGFPNPPPLPNLTLPSLLLHLVFGAILGAVYQYLR